MHITISSVQGIDTGVSNAVSISQSGVEYLGDFAELVLQFARAVGYTYVKQVILLKDDGTTEETLR
jgi:hypothetical protein